MLEANFWQDKNNSQKLLKKKNYMRFTKLLNRIYR